MGLAGKDLTKLELAWVIAFPNAITMRSQAAVVGNTLFLPVGESNNRLFAFDISDNVKPCIQWIYEGQQTLRTSAGFGVRKDGKKVVMVGDMGGFVHMIDAMNGKELWSAHMGLFPGIDLDRHACAGGRQGDRALLPVRDHAGGAGQL